jgi:hypothetical protein
MYPFLTAKTCHIFNLLTSHQHNQHNWLAFYQFNQPCSLFNDQLDTHFYIQITKLHQGHTWSGVECSQSHYNNSEASCQCRMSQSSASRPNILKSMCFNIPLAGIFY